ncbi:ATP phosphoribosyltransferase regulatory subunit [Rhodobacteraceae bacterium XHP0102]|nr:ATP phosphoribosyltransferase regulatory subunit [Rhodobacteraceae bacterium XHP0102]
MSQKVAIRADAERFFSAFQAAGAVAFEADHLLPADTLLDLYGEDIRARAYVTHDPNRGEMMLRPDFTVPVVQRHMSDGAEPARYCYMGEVFRKQEASPARASEYLQVGYELFDRDDPARADAEVFMVFARLLAPYGLRAVTGDIGIILAAIAALDTTARRKRALRRHVWRPRRFRRLLDRFAGRVAAPSSRAELISAMTQNGAEALVAAADPWVGLRARGDVLRRMRALAEDDSAPAISMAQAEALDKVLSLRETLPNAVAQLRDLAVDLPLLDPAIDRMLRRTEALSAAGIAVEDLWFEASYGRTNMEYYDGFVFGFFNEADPHMPPVATGGRYDALTKILGNGREIAAVGGVIRPELLYGLSKEERAG